MRSSTVHFKVFSIFLILSLLAACGGSGGSSDDDAQEVKQLFACLLFPLYCVYPVSKADGPEPAHNPEPAVFSEDALGGVSEAQDEQGNRYITGSTSGSLNGGLHAGGMDAYVVKYDPSGTMLWSRQFGTDGNDIGFAVATDVDGGVIVAGYTSGDLSGLGNAGKNDVFGARFDRDGNHQWTRQVGTAGDEAAYSVTADLTGSISVAAVTFGNPVDAPKESDVRKFTIELDGAGNLLQGM